MKQHTAQEIERLVKAAGEAASELGKPSSLIDVHIAYDYNEWGQMAYLATPLYRWNGRVITMPDDRGWPTRAQAEQYAAKLKAEAKSQSVNSELMLPRPFSK